MRIRAADSGEKESCCGPLKSKGAKRTTIRMPTARRRKGVVLEDLMVSFELSYGR